MKIRDSVAFVTGANRRLGLAFAQELFAGGRAMSTLEPETPKTSRWLEWIGCVWPPGIRTQSVR
jgi:hypothetical protein